MKRIRLGIALSDKVHENALAEYIAENYKIFEVFVGENSKNTEYCIEDKDVMVPVPVSELVKKIVKECGFNYGVNSKDSNVLFTGFTAGCGGCGVTTIAKLYTKIMELSGRKCAFISFNAYEGGKRNDLTDLKLTGLSEFLEGISSKKDLDEVVLDVPCSFRYRKELMNMCERQVVVYSWQERRRDCSDAVFKELQLISEMVPSPGAVYAFSPRRDEERFTGAEPDVMGQLGCEVRNFAEKLGVYNAGDQCL